MTRFLMIFKSFVKDLAYESFGDSFEFSILALKCHFPNPIERVDCVINQIHVKAFIRGCSFRELLLAFNQFEVCFTEQQLVPDILCQVVFFTFVGF